MKKLNVLIMIFIFIGLFFQDINLYSLENKTTANSFRVNTILYKRIIVSSCKINIPEKTLPCINQVGNNEPDITFYPNPTTDKINIVNLPTGDSPTNIKILNILGEQVYSSINGDKEISIDISSFQVGTYFVIIDTGILHKILKFQKI
jgi:hypothetical protein